MTSKIIYIAVISFILMSCNKMKESNGTVKSNTFDNRFGYNLDLKEKIVFEGDKKAYDKLFEVYVLDNNTEDFLVYALIMANKYDSSEGYNHVFHILYSTGSINGANTDRDGLCYDYDLTCLDKETKVLALRYFRKAIEKGDLATSKILLDFYDKDKHYPIEELYTDTILIEKAKFNIQEANLILH